jgi:hypothetical protein
MVPEARATQSDEMERTDDKQVGEVGRATQRETHDDMATTHVVPQQEGSGTMAESREEVPIDETEMDLGSEANGDGREDIRQIPKRMKKMRTGKSGDQQPERTKNSTRPLANKSGAPWSADIPNKTM